MKKLSKNSAKKRNPNFIKWEKQGRMWYSTLYVNKEKYMYVKLIYIKISKIYKSADFGGWKLNTCVTSEWVMLFIVNLFRLLIFWNGLINYSIE